MPQESKKRALPLDTVRVLAMLAVIVLHTSSGYIWNESKLALSGVNLAFFLNQAARFAVPTFILLSGVSLGLSSAPFSLKRFWISRLTKIVLPYFLWCVIYDLVAVGNLTRLASGDWTGLSGFLLGVLWGSLAPHLYFVPVVIQLYLLYPLLKKWLQHHPMQALVVSFAISAFCLFAAWLLCFGIAILPRPLFFYTYHLVPAWLFYFVCGLFLTGPRLENTLAFTRRHAGLLVGAFVVYALLFIAESKVNLSFDLSVKPTVLPFVFLAFAAGTGVGGRLENRHPFAGLMTLLAKGSYPTYLCHVFVLNWLRQYPCFGLGMGGMLSITLATMIISILFGALWEGVSSLLRQRKRHV